MTNKKKLKICMLTPLPFSTSGGAETLIYDLCQALSRKKTIRKSYS